MRAELALGLWALSHRAGNWEKAVKKIPNKKKKGSPGLNFTGKWFFYLAKMRHEKNKWLW